MMASTIYGLASYYNAFISPVQSYQANPLTNLFMARLQAEYIPKQ